MEVDLESKLEQQAGALKEESKKLGQWRKKAEEHAGQIAERDGAAGRGRGGAVSGGRGPWQGLARDGGAGWVWWRLAGRAWAWRLREVGGAEAIGLKG